MTCVLCEAEVPTLTQRPDREVKVVQGHAVTLPCRAVGGPLPVITWLRDSVNISDEANVILHQNGDLQIKVASVSCVKMIIGTSIVRVFDIYYSYIVSNYIIKMSIKHVQASCHMCNA